MKQELEVKEWMQEEDEDDDDEGQHHLFFLTFSFCFCLFVFRNNGSHLFFIFVEKTPIMLPNVFPDVG